MNETASEDTRKKRPGGQPGNTNAARHYLQTGKLSKPLQYVEHRINALRRHMEVGVKDLKGVISLVDAAAINSACKWERHGLLAQHWLRHEAEKLSASDRLKFSEAIAKASDNRDKNIRALGLDAKPADIWSVIDGRKNGSNPTT